MVIRKILAIMLLAMMLMPITASASGTDASSTLRSWNKTDKWQYVQLGQYMYEKDGTMAPVMWRVLHVEDGIMLMITEDVIDLCQPYHMDSKEDYDFYKVYKHKTGLPILESYEETLLPEWFANTCWPVLIGDDPIGDAFVEESTGKLFCMSTEEWTNTEYGFTKKTSTKPNPSRIAQATPYVKNKKLYDWSSRMTTYEDGYVGACYWTSSIRANERRMQIVGINGHLSWGGWIRINVGVRPAAKLDLSMVRIVSGTGTDKDPYVLERNN